MIVAELITGIEGVLVGVSLIGMVWMLVQVVRVQHWMLAIPALLILSVYLWGMAWLASIIPLEGTLALVVGYFVGLVAGGGYLGWHRSPSV